MFAFAKQIVQHKVGFVAVAAFAVFVFAGKPDDGVQKPANPWSAEPAQATAPKDDSVSAKLGHIATKAGDYAAEKVLGDKDLNPVKLGEETVGRFDETNAAMRSANQN